MTDEEKTELAELKEKCLRKDGIPRKDAETADLERLKVLCEMEPPPLSPDEEVELETLEERAKQGRQILQPGPVEMRRLGDLRKRKQ